MKIYIKTEKYSEDKILYGYNLYIENTLSDSLIGIMNGNKEEVTDIVTKNIFLKNKELLNYNKLVILKYENLDITKLMKYNIDHQQFYNNLSKNGLVISTNPAVFLSDNQPSFILQKQMDRYKLTLNYYNKLKSR